jgi:tripartite-type tricarboxylate transporter receptor subunit TctC
LAGEMLAQRGGFRMTHINYNGQRARAYRRYRRTGPADVDVWHSARRYADTGDLKLIAGAGLDPLPGAEHKPTIAATFPGFNVIAFNAAVGPAGVPRPALEQLSSDIRIVVDSHAFAERTANLGINAKGNTPTELGTWMRQEIEKWVRIARDDNIKTE